MALYAQPRKPRLTWKSILVFAIRYFIFGIRRGQFGITKKPVLLLLSERREGKNKCCSGAGFFFSEEVKNGKTQLPLFFPRRKEKKFAIAPSEAS